MLAIVLWGGKRKEVVLEKESSEVEKSYRHTKVAAVLATALSARAALVIWLLQAPTWAICDVSNPAGPPQPSGSPLLELHKWAI